MYPRQVLVVSLIVASVVAAVVVLRKSGLRQSRPTTAPETVVREDPDVVKPAAKVTGDSASLPQPTIVKADTNLRQRRLPRRDALSSSTKTRTLNDIVAEYAKFTDFDRRNELILEVSQLPTAEAVRQLLNWLESDPDDETRKALLGALVWCDQRDALADEIIDRLTPMYKGRAEVEDRIEIQDVLGELATSKSVETLRGAYLDENVDPLEKLNAAACLLRIRSSDSQLLDTAEAQKLYEHIQIAAQVFDEPDSRSQCYMALSMDLEYNGTFLREMLAREKDTNLHKLLENLVIGKAPRTPKASPTPAEP
ncbi:MAG: hypothetical protein K1X53_09435 [Candidatus Sumerlaeaceae bacterium]|nr:hypothetical protein [Candidatus Sumerlaeaceae bacterium]